MPGVRIQHPTKASTTFTIAVAARPLREPLVCAASIVVAGELRPCGRTHTVKTYHLNLDVVGAAIVSEEIAERLRRIPGQPFVFVNAVDDPPDQVIRIPRPLVVRPRAKPPGGTHVTH